jgi:hypothetical protein
MDSMLGLILRGSKGSFFSMMVLLIFAGAIFAVPVMVIVMSQIELFRERMRPSQKTPEKIKSKAEVKGGFAARLPLLFGRQQA